nr:hypothetical protein Iba_chr03aCG19600 [Ipomoea batatas]GMC76220.1 hypothetical protein Iba_chr03dCG12270 [Ipomoea batatas]
MSLSSSMNAASREVSSKTSSWVLLPLECSLVPALFSALFCSPSAEDLFLKRTLFFRCLRCTD